MSEASRACGLCPRCSTHSAVDSEREKEQGRPSKSVRPRTAPGPQPAAPMTVAPTSPARDQERPCGSLFPLWVNGGHRQICCGSAASTERHALRARLREASGNPAWTCLPALRRLSARPSSGMYYCGHESEAAVCCSQSLEKFMNIKWHLQDGARETPLPVCRPHQPGPRRSWHQGLHRAVSLRPRPAPGRSCPRSHGQAHLREPRSLGGRRGIPSS